MNGIAGFFLFFLFAYFYSAAIDRFFFESLPFLLCPPLVQIFLRTRFTQWEDIHILGNSSSANISVVEKYFFLFLSSSDIFGIGI